MLACIIVFELISLWYKFDLFVNIIRLGTLSKVYPAMYIENVTQLAFNDITPQDPNFSSIQGEDKKFQKSKLYGFLYFYSSIF